MDPNIQKVLSLNVGQRYEELARMSEINDPKVILHLTNEWEFQAKISSILSLKIRADAHNRRGSIGFVKDCLSQIAHLSDGIYECEKFEGHGLKVINRDGQPDLNPKQVEVPSFYFENLGPDIKIIEEIYKNKKSTISDQIKVMQTPIKLVGDSLLQGQSSDWESAGNLFNYFPMNLNKTRQEGLLTDANREDVVRSAIYSVVNRKVKKVALSKENTVITMGSCFATELYVSLKKQGINAETLRIEESINTTHANLLLLQSIVSGNLEPQLQGLFEDANMAHRLTLLRQTIRRASAVVLTVGVAPLVVDKKTGEYVYGKSLKEGFERGQYEMRFSTVKENAQNIEKIVSLLKDMSPDIEVFITLSPVPLIGVPSDQSVLERDVVSKSTIRLAIEEASKVSKFTYWPSFEVVKWIAPHLHSKMNFQAFGDPDNNSRHVSRWLVDEITKSFIENALEIKTS